RTHRPAHDGVLASWLRSGLVTKRREGRDGDDGPYTVRSACASLAAGSWSWTGTSLGRHAACHVRAIVPEARAEITSEWGRANRAGNTRSTGSRRARCVHLGGRHGDRSNP